MAERSSQDTSGTSRFLPQGQPYQTPALSHRSVTRSGTSIPRPNKFMVRELPQQTPGLVAVTPVPEPPIHDFPQTALVVKLEDVPLWFDHIEVKYHQSRLVLSQGVIANFTSLRTA